MPNVAARARRPGKPKQEELVKAALRPFAELSAEIDAGPFYDDDTEVYSYHGIVITVGDLRAARAALEGDE